MSDMQLEIATPQPPIMSSLTDNHAGDGIRYSTREEWLTAAVTMLRAHLFAPFKHVVPDVRVSCGWTRQKNAIGSCFKGWASADGKPQIFISPELGDPVRVLSTLVHELVHAVDETPGHGPTFKRIALDVGLTGRMTSTRPTDELKQGLTQLAQVLGDYPHSPIRTFAASPESWPNSRMLKMLCVSCGCTIRTSAKWLDYYGNQWQCPCGDQLLRMVTR
jgi:hypothetical protein